MISNGKGCVITSVKRRGMTGTGCIVTGWGAVSKATVYRDVGSSFRLVRPKVRAHLKKKVLIFNLFPLYNIARNV